jgi:tetraacyldisaccharide 4'-kinase
VTSEAPPFWWEPADWRAYALSPLSALYGLVAGNRMVRARPSQVELPVLCVGNFTVGGTGKTPVAIALARQASAMGLKPGFLSRGHGGSFSHPRLVDLEHDSAAHVGDEPLLLAAHAPVAVTPKRAVGARLLQEKGCDFIIMDDGFQSARIHIDYALIVVDARFGVGNGHVIPGGPLRAPLLQQLRFADAVLKVGEGTEADDIVRKASRAGKSVFEAKVKPRRAEALAGRRFLAFAGIGHPEKFFDTVGRAGGEVVLKRPFADHHPYRDEDIEELALAARADGLELVTTAKDAARLRDGAKARAFLESLHVLEIEIEFDLKRAPTRIIDETVEAWRRRRLGG